jgi:two-component system, OmpR family, copper resistance phosphate regulon response regulator CusR
LTLEDAAVHKTIDSPPLASPHVLVVEDEPKTQAALVEGLELEGWKVSATGCGNEARELLTAHHYDLLVLDWMLPGTDGQELLRHVRRHGSEVAVLMLTARSSINDRLRGFEGGVDDYLVKPFEFAELVARCRALLRRSGPTDAHILYYHDLSLDTRARVAVRAGVEISLTPREEGILEYLLRHQGQIVTREMLEREVWRQPRRMTSLDNVLDVHIMHLRQKIDGAGAPKLIHTLRGLGYRLSHESE